MRNSSDNLNLNLTALQKAIGQLSISGMFDYCVMDKPFSLDSSHMVWLGAASRIIFVEDGSETGNLKFVRAAMCMDMDRFNDKVLLLYNKVQSGRFNELTQMNLPVLGKVEQISAPDRKALEQQIGERQLFASLAMQE
ncbi:MAG: hypothetical protein LIO37_03570 [Clostridiales bacterium]|nr:hypothetical protein [Clostridiales bacterium]